MENKPEIPKFGDKKRVSSDAAKARLKRLDGARRAMGWTWGQLATSVGVSRQTASFWSNSERSVPEPAVRLAELLVKVRDLQK